MASALSFSNKILMSDGVMVLAITIWRLPIIFAGTAKLIFKPVPQHIINSAQQPDK